MSEVFSRHSLIASPGERRSLSSRNVPFDFSSCIGITVCAIFTRYFPNGSNIIVVATLKTEWKPAIANADILPSKMDKPAPYLKI